MDLTGIGQVLASEVDGPGVRAVVHFAGCSIGCAGCFNPHTHASDGGSTWKRSTQSVASEMLAISRDVSISGGEPTDQPVALLSLICALRRGGARSIVVYSGRRIEYLRARVPLWREIEARIDTLIDGPFVVSKLATDGRGSTNQRFIHLSDRFTDADFADRSVDMTIDPETGMIMILGFPPPDLLADLSESGLVAAGVMG